MRQIRKALTLGACSATLLAFPVGQASAQESRYADPTSGKLTSKPRSIQYRDVTYSKLKWRGWNKSKARASGRYRLLICEPTCANGRVIRGSASVTLSKRKRAKGRLVYQCTRGTLRGNVPSEYRRTFNCA